MLDIDYSPNFLSIIGKIKNKADQDKIKKQVKRIIENPEIGNPCSTHAKEQEKFIWDRFDYLTPT